MGEIAQVSNHNSLDLDDLIFDINNKVESNRGSAECGGLLNQYTAELDIEGFSLFQLDEASESESISQSRESEPSNPTEGAKKRGRKSKRP